MLHLLNGNVLTAAPVTVVTAMAHIKRQLDFDVHLCETALATDKNAKILLFAISDELLG